MAKKTFTFSESNTKFFLLGQLGNLMSLVDRIYLDKSFQRNGCWDPTIESAFCTSLILGNTPSPIVVVDLKKSLERTTPNSKDYKYFKSLLDENYVMLSIDGNNRARTLKKFFDDKISIVHGQYKVGGYVVDIDSSNDRWSTLPKEILDHVLENVGISFMIYEVSCREDCSTLFVNINNGVALNKQELRNARLTPIAEEIRKLASDSIDDLKYIFKKGDDRYIIQETITTMACHYTFQPNHGVVTKDLDQAYEDNSPVWPQFINEGGKDCIQKTIKMVGKFADKSFKNKSTLINLFMLVSFLQKNNRKILKESEFFSWFVKTESKRLTEIAYKDSTGEALTYETCNRSTNKRDAFARYNLLLKDLSLIPSGIISDTLDNRRIFSKIEKRKAWELADHKCENCDKECPEYQIFDSDLWHAHHKVPHSKGGRTNQENCALLCRDCNLKIGDNSDFVKFEKAA